MQFLYPSLTWAFALVAIPLVIHLINMLRHRRVRWAAMDFLLESYRKQRRWIWLKQLLLLLARMAAIALLVAMLAHLVTSRQWWQVFASQTTHHYIVLDDSLSMADQQLSGSAFELGEQVIGRLAQLASQQPTPQRITLLRASRAGAAVPDQQADPEATLADWLQYTVDVEADVRWESLRRRLDVSQLAVDLVPALKMVQQWVRQASGEQAVVYVVSDFRSRDWQQPAELLESLEQLSEIGCQIHLVRCVDQAHENLAVTRLQPAPGTLVAGVPLFMEVGITNFGSQTAEGVQVGLRTIEYRPQEEQPRQEVELPSLTIDQIPPGQTVVRRAQVHFGTAGQQVVEATLAEDALDLDNRRLAVVDLPDRVTVLIVDGSLDQQNAFYVGSVFDRTEGVLTGVRPVVESASFLRDASQEQLERFAAIYLLDVPQLSEEAARHLVEYMQHGGGVVMALGPEADNNAYRQLNQVAPELMPVKLVTVGQLPPAPDTRTPDLLVEDHPIFQRLASRGGQVNPFLARIRIYRFHRIEPITEALEQDGLRTLARLRDDSPLVLEKGIGQGRLVLWLTSFHPQWNNWVQEPTFPIVILQQQAHVAAGDRNWVDRRTGDPIRVAVDPRLYRPEVELVRPAAAAAGGQRIRTRAENSEEMGPSWVQWGVDAEGRRTGETDASGLYSVVLEKLQAGRDVNRLAVNVPLSESELALADAEDLQQRLEPLGVQLQNAQTMSFAGLEEPVGSWSRILMWVLVVGLLLEQLLAYSASYHSREEVPL